MKVEASKVKTIGETLKGRRERLGMTLTELEQRTQLKRETLKYIEENKFDQLAKVDYAEGFIRRYASVVNMDVNQLIKVHHEEILINIINSIHFYIIIDTTKCPNIVLKIKNLFNY